MATLIESTNGDTFGLAKAAHAGEPRGNEMFLSMGGLRKDCYIHTAEFYLGKPVKSGKILGCCGGGICFWASLHDGMVLPFKYRTEIADSGKGSINELGGFGMMPIDHFDYTIKYHNYEPFVLYAKDGSNYYVFDVTGKGLTAHSISISSPEDLRTYAGECILLADWLRRPQPDIIFRPGALYELRTKHDPDFLINYGTALKPDQIHAYVRPGSNDNKNKWYVEVSDDDTFDLINYNSGQMIDVNEKIIYVPLPKEGVQVGDPNVILWYVPHDCFQMYPKRKEGFNEARMFQKPHDTPEHGTISKSARQLEGIVYQTELICSHEYATTNREVDSHYKLRCCAQFNQNGEDTNLRYAGNPGTNCFGFSRTYPYNKWIPKPSILGFINDDGEEVPFAALSGEEHIEFNIPLFANYGVQCRYFELQNGLNERHGMWCALSMCVIGGHVCSLEKIKDITDAHNIMLYFRFVGEFGTGPCSLLEFSWWPYRQTYTSGKDGVFMYNTKTRTFRMKYRFSMSFVSFGSRLNLKKLDGHKVTPRFTNMATGDGDLIGYFNIPISKMPVLPADKATGLLEVYSESVQVQPTLVQGVLRGNLNIKKASYGGNGALDLGFRYDRDTQSVMVTLPNNGTYVGGLVIPTTLGGTRLRPIPFMSNKSEIIMPLPYRYDAKNIQFQLVFEPNGAAKLSHYTFYADPNWVEKLEPQAIWFIDDYQGALTMRCNVDSPYTTNRSLSSTVTKKNLMNDSTAAVYYEESIDDTIKIEGMVPDAQALSFRNALLQKKAFFRAPNGFYGYVGITNVDLVSKPGYGYMNETKDFDMYTTVNISMVRIADYGGTWIL